MNQKNNLRFGIIVANKQIDRYIVAVLDKADNAAYGGKMVQISKEMIGAIHYISVLSKCLPAASLYRS